MNLRHSVILNYYKSANNDIVVSCLVLSKQTRQIIFRGNQGLL